MKTLFDLERIMPGSLEPLNSVISGLIDNTHVSSTSIMVIGAFSRDLLHAGFGRTENLRSTSDLDIAIAVQGHQEYQRIVSSLPKVGSTDVRFAMGGIQVDLVPFGEIEDPPGTTSLPGRNDSFDVFGFREVFTGAAEIGLSNGHSVRIPTPAGYAALKLKAWCDRSLVGEYKDAGDIHTACNWYEEDADIRASLYNERADLLLRTELDVVEAALLLLGEDIARLLGSERVSELAAAWIEADSALFTVYFARARSSIDPDYGTAKRLIRALTDFLE